jgi:hypothetical protein
MKSSKPDKYSSDLNDFDNKGSSASSSGSKQRKSEFNFDQDDLKKESALTTAIRLSESPELSCGSGKSICIDIDKVLALKKSENF